MRNMTPSRLLVSTASVNMLRFFRLTAPRRCLTSTQHVHDNLTVHIPPVFTVAADLLGASCSSPAPSREQAPGGRGGEEPSPSGSVTPGSQLRCDGSKRGSRRHSWLFGENMVEL
ncbi:unnamed protein product [Pleuronectes platessa]|uniref:Uncharacterized protein n=1 Tax=Pleuronectes platessa TaxID=8262 RepID=A0A9N7YP25_PLEPL|nr:unnamed protein product [Pleuronectes platessa]